MCVRVTERVRGGDGEEREKLSGITPFSSSIELVTHFALLSFNSFVQTHIYAHTLTWRGRPKHSPAGRRMATEGASHKAQNRESKSEIREKEYRQKYRNGRIERQTARSDWQTTQRSDWQTTQHALIGGESANRVSFLF